MPYRGAPVNDLRADPEVLRQVPAATLEQSRSELADLTVHLAEQPDDPDGWMRVAFIKRFYRDYAGARDAYEYVNVIAPHIGVPFQNLGILYGYYLKEPARAIPKYERAIALEPGNPSFYLEFANFWRDVVGDSARAEATLLDGLKRLPGDPSLAAALALLYEARGDTAEAIAYYELARDGHAIGSAERVAIERELARLKAAP